MFKNKSRVFFGAISVLAFLLVIGVVLLFSTGKSYAANPQIIPFQGKVVNADGTNVVNGAYNFDFVLYDDSTLGSPSDGVHDKWHELSKSVTVTNGVFQTNLGSATALPDFNANPSLYLAIRFNGDAAGYMTPRIQMGSVPYALNSDALGGISKSGFVQIGPSAAQSDTSANSSIFVDKNNASGNILELQKSSSDVFTISNNGDFLSQTNSATGFQIQTSGASDTLLTADTSANNVKIGNSTGTNTNTTQLIVDSATTDPSSGTNGAIYYNTTNNKFRCYQNTAWANCLAANTNSTGSFVSGLANVAASTTGVAVETLVFTAATTVSNTAGATGFPAPASGSFRTCLVKNNAAITNGTLSVRWRVNGTSVGSVACTMNSTVNRSATTALDGGVVTFAQGDIIGIAFDTDASFAPTGSNDFTVYWTVEYNSTATEAGATLQSAYNNGNSVTTTDNRDFIINAADTATDSSILFNLQCITSCSTNGRFAVQNAGSDVFSIAPNSGDATFTGQVNASNLGIEFSESNTNPTCSSGNYTIYADTSDAKLKKCQNGTLTDLDTVGTDGVTATNFTSGGTWTKSNYPGLKFTYVITTGSGGGGGGADGVDTSSEQSAGGGGAGGTAIEMISAGSLGSTETVTVGTAGTSGSNTGGNGGAGNTSSFGAFNSANGGSGGGGASSSGGAVCNAAGLGSGGAGGTASGGDTNLSGGSGTGAFYCAAENTRGGLGGASYWGGQTKGGSSEAANSCDSGDTGSAYGAGGGGAVCEDNTGGATGGAGAGGIVSTLNYTSSSGDLAEWYETTTDVQTGDIVSLSGSLLQYNSRLGPDTTSVLKKAVFGSNLVGVVSTSPYQVIGGDLLGEATHPQPIALAGRVPVSVSDENGPVKTGDLITASSVPGVGMRSTKAGLTIGTALANANCTPGSICKVLIMVNTVYSPGAMINKAMQADGIAMDYFPGEKDTGRDIGLSVLAQMIQQDKNISKAPQLDISKLSEISTDILTAEQEIITPKVTTDKLRTNNISSPGSDDVSINSNVTISGVLKVNKIVVSQIEGLEPYDNPQARLNSTGSYQDSDTTKGGRDGVTDEKLSIQQRVSTLTIDQGLSVGGDAEFRGSSFFYGLVTFVEKNVFKNDITLQGHLITDGQTPKLSSPLGNSFSIRGNDSAGHIEIYNVPEKTKGIIAEVNFSKPYELIPIVSITPASAETGALRYYVDSDSSGFRIMILDPQQQQTDLKYNYWVVQ